MKKRSPYCKYCGEELPVRAFIGHRQRQFCNDACRQANHRSRVRRARTTKYLIQGDLVGFETPEQRAQADIRETVELIGGYKVAFGVEATAIHKGVQYKGVLYPVRN